MLIFFKIRSCLFKKKHQDKKLTCLYICNFSNLYLIIIYLYLYKNLYPRIYISKNI